MTRLPWSTALWLALVCLVVLVRLPGLEGRGPWLDERVSLNEAAGSYYRGPFPGETFTPADFWAENSVRNVVVATQSGEGGLGLPYHVLLHFWIGAFGPDEISVRGLSLILGVAVVGLTFVLGRALLGTPGGVVAAVLCGLHPVSIQMSQEIRSYALATGFCLLGALFLAELAGPTDVKNSRVRAAVLGVSLALGFASHYAAASVVIGILAFGVFSAARNAERRPLLLGAFTVFCGCMLIWLLTLGLDGLRHFAAESATRRGALAAGDADWAWVHPATPRYLVAGSAGALLTLLGSTLQSSVRVAILAPFLAILAYYLFHGWRIADSSTRRAICLGTTVMGTGIGIAILNALANGHDSGLSGRYFAFHVPFAALLFAAVIVRRWATASLRKQVVLVVGLHALLIGASLPAVYRTFTHERRPNIYSEIARVIRSHEHGTALVAFPTWIDARTTCLYEGPHIRVPHRVLGRAGNDVVLYDADGRVLQQLTIDRTLAH